MSVVESTCPGCKVVLPAFDGPTHAYMEASPACWELFSRVLAREYGEPEYMAVHRLTVDGYAAQHPGRPEGRTIRSVNSHLVALHLSLDRRLEARFVTRIIGVVVKRLKDDLVWLAPPESLGSITVADVAKVANAQSHRAAVRSWAGAVWSAWLPHRAAVLALADKALSIGGAG